MKKKHFVFIFISVHLVFIVAQIHKQAIFITLTYQKQRYEKKINKLKEHINTITSKMYTLQNQHDVKKFAQSSLAMKKVTIDQIRKLQHEHSL